MDRLLNELFKPERWETAIETGVDKDMPKGELRALTTPDVRVRFYKAIRDGHYAIAPPHTALIPKDTPGEYRTVYICENVDRIFLSIVNNMLFELCGDMVHQQCKSYQTGIGTGKVVQECSRLIARANGKVIGFKSDLSKYFDSVPLQYINEVFDKVEARVGKSKVIDVLRAFYASDLYFDTDGKLAHKFQSLKQGVAVASFLADAMLFDMDEAMSKRGGFYVRYSDDCLYIGPDYEDAMQQMRNFLAAKELTLNPKKIEYIDGNRWVKFLGFALKKNEISISPGRLKSFQKEVEKRTIGRKGISEHKAVCSLNAYLYKGDGKYSWATGVLPIITNQHDIDLLNDFCMDALRAVATGKTKIGGLGYNKDGKNGVVVRGTGKNVRANREKTAKRIDGYRTIRMMRNALVTDRGAYAALVRTM